MPKINRNKPKNYHWTPKGTKASRRNARKFSKNNVIHTDVLQVNKNRPKSERYKQGSIKQLARTGGVKALNQDKFVDLTSLASEAAESLAAAMGAMRTEIQDSSADGVELTVKDTTKSSAKKGDDPGCATVEDLTKYLADDHEVETGLAVKSKYVNSAGTVTTMVYANKVPRYGISDPVEETERDVKIIKLELSLNVKQLVNLAPGSIMKLKVDAIVTPNTHKAEALITDLGHPKPAGEEDEALDPYGFLAYDGDEDEDSESEDDDEPNMDEKGMRSGPTEWQLKSVHRRSEEYVWDCPELIELSNGSESDTSGGPPSVPKCYECMLHACDV